MFSVISLLTLSVLPTDVWKFDPLFTNGAEFCPMCDIPITLVSASGAPITSLPEDAVYGCFVFTNSTDASLVSLLNGVTNTGTENGKWLPSINTFGSTLCYSAGDKYLGYSVELRLWDGAHQYTLSAFEEFTTLPGGGRTIAKDQKVFAPGISWEGAKKFYVAPHNPCETCLFDENNNPLTSDCIPDGNDECRIGGSGGTLCTSAIGSFDCSSSGHPTNGVCNFGGGCLGDCFLDGDECRVNHAFGPQLCEPSTPSSIPGPSCFVPAPAPPPTPPPPLLEAPPLPSADPTSPPSPSEPIVPEFLSYTETFEKNIPKSFSLKVNKTFSFDDFSIPDGTLIECNSKEFKYVHTYSNTSSNILFSSFEFGLGYTIVASETFTVTFEGTTSIVPSLISVVSGVPNSFGPTRSGTIVGIDDLSEISEKNFLVMNNREICKFLGKLEDECSFTNFEFGKGYTILSNSTFEFNL